MFVMAKRKKPAAGSNPWPRKLKAYRERLDITQEEAAQRAGVTRRAWIFWEVGTKVPSKPFAVLLDLLIQQSEEI